MLIYTTKKSFERWDHSDLTSKDPARTGWATLLGSEKDKSLSLPWGSPRDWWLGSSPVVLPSLRAPGSCPCVAITPSSLLRTGFFYFLAFWTKSTLGKKVLLSLKFWKWEKKMQCKKNLVGVFVRWFNLLSVSERDSHIQALLCARYPF